MAERENIVSTPPLTNSMVNADGTPSRSWAIWFRDIFDRVANKRGNAIDQNEEEAVMNITGNSSNQKLSEDLTSLNLINQKLQELEKLKKELLIMRMAIYPVKARQTEDVKTIQRHTFRKIKAHEVYVRTKINVDNYGTESVPSITIGKNAGFYRSSNTINLSIGGSAVIQIDANKLQTDYGLLNNVGLDLTSATAVLKIDGTQVLSKTALGSTVLSSSLTSVGTLNSLNVSTNISISGTQVITSRQADVPDATGGTTIDAEARAAINNLLARLRTHGLIG